MHKEKYDFSATSYKYIQMNHIHKAAAIFLIVVTAIIGLSFGIQTYKSKQKAADKKESALLQLKERYGEEFEIVKVISDTRFEAVCRPKEHPEVLFRVYMPETELSTENYRVQTITRKIQENCNAVLSEGNFDFYCEAVGTKIRYEASQKNQYPDYDHTDPFDNYKELSFNLYIYIPYKGEYDAGEMFEMLSRLTKTASYSDVVLSINFANRAEMKKIRNYYDNSVIMQGYSADVLSGASLYCRGGELNKTKDEYITEFCEQQERARNYYQAK